MDDNKNKPMGWPILYTLATLAGVAVLAILKACGIISMSWPVVIAGLVWVPTALLLITLWVATLLIWIGRTEKKIREYNLQEKDLPHSGRIHERAHAKRRRPHLWY